MQVSPAFPSKKIKILAVSDTHFNHKDINIASWPDADVFIHAGDFTVTSTQRQFADFRDFLKRLPYRHKLVVAGNHDFGLEPSQEKYLSLSQAWQIPKSELVDTQKEINKLKQVCTLLMHESVEIQGVTFFGTPHVWLKYDMGFIQPNIKKEEIWSKVPEKLDVLITHIPPFGVRDQTVFKQHVGCKRLLEMVTKISPRIHIFGHIHESYGDIAVGPTHFYNVCYLDANYSPKNRPILIELDIPQKRD